jgi:hypothetical protein
MEQVMSEERGQVQRAVWDDKMLARRLVTEFPDLLEDEPALIDTLDGISDLDEKIAAAIRVALVREAMADGIKVLMEQLTSRRQRLESGATKIRGTVLWAMQETGRTKISKPDMTVSVIKGRDGIVVTDETIVPEEYMVVTTRPDMRALADAVLKEGKVIEGVAKRNAAPHLTVRTS